MLKNNKFLNVLKNIFFICIVVGITAIPVVSYASITATPKLESYVKITDSKTGKVTQYALDNDVNTQVVTNKDGEKEYVSTFNIRNKPKTGFGPNTAQTVEDTFNGYKGTIKIYYTDDGKYVCLEKIFASWDKKSGNSTISEKSINYGQVLGTNSEKGYIDMSGSVIKFSTGFKPGKYGYGEDFFIGANLNAKIDSDYVCVVCNYNI